MGLTGYYVVQEGGKIYRGIREQDDTYWLVLSKPKSGATTLILSVDVEALLSSALKALGVVFEG